MRCPNCQKFVSYEDPPEIEEIYSDIEGLTVAANIRVILKCAECGTELKDAELRFEMEIEHECTGEPVFKLDSIDYEGMSRVHTTVTVWRAKRDENGKIIRRPDGKSVKVAVQKPIMPRYWKTFYGTTVEAIVHCETCDEYIELTSADEEQASSFAELV